MVHVTNIDHCETFDEVLVASKALFEYCQQELENKQKEEMEANIDAIPVVVMVKVMVVKKSLMMVEVLRRNLKILLNQKKVNLMVEPHNRVVKLVVSLVLMEALMV